MSDAETELLAALAALASDDDEQALERLVAAWNACRAAPLVAMIDTLAERIEPRAKALGGKTANERYGAFRTTAARTRQADLGRLVALLPRLAYGDVSTALDTLLYHWPPTPRMRALLEPIQLPGYGDRLDELRTVHATARDEPLSDRARATLAELDRVLAVGEEGAQLLAQVFADPAADAPRLVYADWATSRGDPRGELITLQFARRERTPDPAAVRRERELLDHYAQRWLAPLWSAIRPYSVRFERGFLAAVTVEPFAVIAPRPEWSTVIALELAYHDALPIDAFPALRELRNVTPKLLAQIAARPTRLLHLGLAEEPGKPSHAMIPELRDGGAFPELRSLGVWGRPEDWTWLWPTRLGAELRRIEVTRQPTGASPWLTAALPPHVREVSIRERANEARLVREGDAFPVLEVICREPTRDLLAWAHMLEFVPPRSLRSVRFVLSYRPKQETVGRLERMVRRSHPALKHFSVDVDPFI